MPAPNEIGHTRFLREDGTWVEVEATGGGGIATEDVVIDNSLTIVGGEPNYISIQTIDERFELENVDIMSLFPGSSLTINCVQDKNITIGLNDTYGYENSCMIGLSEMQGSITPLINKMDTERYYTADLNITCEDAQRILIYPIEDTEVAGDYLTRNVILYSDEPFSTQVDRINSFIVRQRTEVIAAENRKPPITVKNTYSNENIHVLDWNGNATYTGDVTATDENGIKYSLIDVAKNGGSSGGSVPTNAPVFTGSISLGRKDGSNIGDNSVAFGGNAVASGNYSFATGSGSIASGQGAHAEGVFFTDGRTTQNTSATGQGAHAEGIGTQSTGIGSHSEGRLAIAEGRGSHAEGDTTRAGNANATINTNVSPLADYQSSAAGAGAHAEGIGSNANFAASHAEGYKTQAKEKAAHSEGIETVTSGVAAHAEGEQTHAYSVGSHAEGKSTQAGGKDGTVANPYAHAEGVETIAIGRGSHAEGGVVIDNDNTTWKTTAEGDYSHAEGAGTKTQGLGSHAEGVFSQATGQSSHAEGNNTQAKATASHAEGYNTVVNEAAIASHAEGRETVAGDEAAHAEGYGSQALGYISHAEGWNTVAEAQGSHAEGLRTIAKGKYQHVQGKYNVEDTVDTSGYGKYSHIVGGGSNTERKNIHTLDWNGNAWYEGQVHARQGLKVGTVVAEYGCVAVGDRTSAIGPYSIAVGDYVSTEGHASFAHGYDTHAKGRSSFVSGEHSLALGDCSFTEGIGHDEYVNDTHKIANPFAITSIGRVNDTTMGIRANSIKPEIYFFLQSYQDMYENDMQLIPGKILLYDSLYENETTIVGGYYLHCGEQEFYFMTDTLPSTIDTTQPSRYIVREIEVDISKGFSATHVQGKYSKLLPNYAHIVGGGTSNTDRKNIYTLDWDGNATFGNDVALAGLQLNQWMAAPSNLSTISFTDLIHEMQNSSASNIFVPTKDMNTAVLPALLESYQHSFYIPISSELPAALGGKIASSLIENYFVGTLSIRTIGQDTIDLQNTLITRDRVLDRLVVWTAESVDIAQVYTMTFNSAHMASNAIGISLLETIKSLQERIAALEAQLA